MVTGTHGYRDRYIASHMEHVARMEELTRYWIHSKRLSKDRLEQFKQAFVLIAPSPKENLDVLRAPFKEANWLVATYSDFVAMGTFLAGRPMVAHIDRCLIHTPMRYVAKRLHADFASYVGKEIFISRSYVPAQKEFVKLQENFLHAFYKNQNLIYVDMKSIIEFDEVALSFWNGDNSISIVSLSSETSTMVLEVGK